MRTLTAVAGLVGGLCWVGFGLAGAGGSADVLEPLGAALLALAVLGAGARLVSRSAGWLRVVVAVCFLVLVASVLQVLRDNLDDELVLAGAGGVAVLVAVVALLRRPPRASRHRGTHAA